MRVRFDIQGCYLGPVPIYRAVAVCSTSATSQVLVLDMQKAQQAYMQQLWRDALGFGGCVMIRRIVGIAHVDDFRDIKDADVRYAEPAGQSKCMALTLEAV